MDCPIHHKKMVKKEVTIGWGNISIKVCPECQKEQEEECARAVLHLAEEQ